MSANKTFKIVVTKPSVKNLEEMLEIGLERVRAKSGFYDSNLSHKAKKTPETPATKNK